ncbi:hypothetical protein SH580_17630 [Coraliomargarita algicola]|uniref:Uncharacterized protein n=1 Tax=Coraliomargarita algicola TaxID=3092156 RepID=A0ABZ0RGL4_9BACT|nr:hypothetical protein [Coraliomargarita sp. J2-16]WPJ95246.1 hypothetical protein SH580_17630 [Coraliomargarita sp. J2-16]
MQSNSLQHQAAAERLLRSCLTPGAHGSRNERHPRQVAPITRSSLTTTPRAPHTFNPASPPFANPPRYAPSAQSSLPPFCYASALVNP